MSERRRGFSDKKIGLNEDRDLTKGNEFTFSNIKNLIPNDSLFNINSHIFNIQNNRNEKRSTFDCFYSPSTESLSIIIEEKNKYSELSKEIVINLMEFAGKVNAKTLLILIDRKNKDYVKIMQSMMMIGFHNDAQFKTAKLFEKEFKLLKMELRAQSDAIEEVTF